MNAGPHRNVGPRFIIHYSLIQYKIEELVTDNHIQRPVKVRDDHISQN